MSTLRRRRVKKMHLRIPICRSSGKFRPRDGRNTFLLCNIFSSLVCISESYPDFCCCLPIMFCTKDIQRVILPLLSRPTTNLDLFISLVHLYQLFDSVFLYSPATSFPNCTKRYSDHVASKFHHKRKRSRNWFSLGQVAGMNNANF